ncbi:MAG: epimerase [Candidatus Schekmanbacteria bacterium]|nr:epimerase [Candidatus Schekmanbacteria bacterium]
MPHILILGGSLFLGRHLVETAVPLGWNVTVFNRGKTRPEPLPGAEHVQGDRVADLGRLAGRRWDAIIDTCGYIPAAVSVAGRTLRDAAELYVFISSISAYATFRPWGDETDALAELAPGAAADVVTAHTYGSLKVLCEREAHRAFPGGTLIVRPGFIVGPYDPTGRFSYWVHRIAAGGQVLVPAVPEQPLQLIDARDLASWILGCIAERTVGTFDVVGPAAAGAPRAYRFADVMHAIARVAGANAAELVWADTAWLSRMGVSPEDLPFWEDVTDWDAERRNPARALARGLRTRPLAETIADTLAWLRAGTDSRSTDAGNRRSGSMTRDREAAVVAACLAQRGPHATA